MAKNKTVFVCNNCGYESPKWMGKCPACGEWNSFFEEKVITSKNSNGKTNKERVKPIELSKIEGKETTRVSTGFDELDRVLQVDSIKFVDYTILANQDIKKYDYKDIKNLQTNRYCEIVNELKPDILVHPKGHTNPNELEKLYNKLNTKIIEIERNKDKPSTTEIINKIRNKKQDKID